MIAKLSVILNRNEWVSAALAGPAFPVGLACALMGSIGMALALPSLADGPWEFVLIGLVLITLHRVWWQEHQEIEEEILQSVSPNEESPNQDWIDHAYPLQQVTIKLQGTKHSERASVINQLQEVMKRLEAGEMEGLEHDDDFGYSFKFVSASSGPTIFNEATDER